MYFHNVIRLNQQFLDKKMQNNHGSHGMILNICLFHTMTSNCILLMKVRKALTIFLFVNYRFWGNRWPIHGCYKGCLADPGSVGDAWGQSRCRFLKPGHAQAPMPPWQPWGHRGLALGTQGDSENSHIALTQSIFQNKCSIVLFTSVHH